MIQVAAVAVAIVQDLDHGSADGYNADQVRGVLSDVVSERHRQDQKWGVQHHPIFAWLTILGEEVGEACQAALEEHFTQRSLEEAP